MFTVRVSAARSDDLELHLVAADIVYEIDGDTICAEFEVDTDDRLNAYAAVYDLLADLMVVGKIEVL